jgi:hypothetical protein
MSAERRQTKKIIKHFATYTRAVPLSAAIRAAGACVAAKPSEDPSFIIF